MPNREKQSWLYRFSEAFIGTAIFMISWPLSLFAIASASNAFAFDIGGTTIFGISLLVATIASIALFDLAHHVCSRLWAKVVHPSQRDRLDEK
ncbi:MAG: hypothetical protein ABJ205_13090 [Erythrobacter sp.]|uniref:hypothetical protein n=1 Tax=Erythrobacter sp. TaxID=1042 RepID=UPI0032658B47